MKRSNYLMPQAGETGKDFVWSRNKVCYNLHSSAARPASLSAAAANATVATAAATASAGAGVFVTRLMDLDLGSPAYVVPFVEIPNGSNMATDLICRAIRNSTIAPSSVRITRLLFEPSTRGCKNIKKLLDASSLAIRSWHRRGQATCFATRLACIIQQKHSSTWSATSEPGPRHMFSVLRAKQTKAK